MEVIYGLVAGEVFKPKALLVDEEGRIFANAISAAVASDGSSVYPDSWAHRGPLNVNDPGYIFNGAGKLVAEIIGNHPDPANCTVFYQKTYTWDANGKPATDSGWVKL